MRTLRIILVIAVVMAFVLGLFRLLPMLTTKVVHQGTQQPFESHYAQLQHQSPEYYAELAAACDSIMAQNPLGVADVCWPPITDPSLPAIIRDLHPTKIQIDRHGFWMIVDGKFLEWQPSSYETNVWTLDILTNGLEKVIYSAKRTVPPNKSLQPTRGGALGLSKPRIVLYCSPRVSRHGGI